MDRSGAQYRFGRGLFRNRRLRRLKCLIANGLDNLSDSFVYAISLFALSRSAKWKRGAANVSGGLLILFAAGILYDAWRRYIGGSDPLETIMIAIGPDRGGYQRSLRLAAR